MKQVLIINGHPDRHSFNHALAAAYAQGIAATGAHLAQINIGELDFNPNLQYGYRQRMELEPDLMDAITKMQAADHLVWIFPMWWYSCPAIMKGFVYRTFLPGIAYDNIPGKPFPKKLWKGKTGHIIVTSDTPGWYDFLLMKRPAINQFKRGTLEFCGVSPVQVTYIAPIKNSKATFRAKWVSKVQQLAERTI